MLQPAQSPSAQGHLGRTGSARGPLAELRLRGTDGPSLDVFWLKDKSLVDLDNLPEPDELAEQIIENLEAGLDGFREVLATLR